MAKFGFTSKKRKQTDDDAGDKVEKKTKIAGKVVQSKEDDGGKASEKENGVNKANVVKGGDASGNVDNIDEFLSNMDSVVWKERLISATKTHSFKRLVKMVGEER